MNKDEIFTPRISVGRSFAETYEFLLGGFGALFIASSVHLVVIVLSVVAVGTLNGTGWLNEGMITASLIILSIWIVLVVNDLSMNLMRIALFGKEYAMPIYSSPRFYTDNMRIKLSQFYWKFVGKRFLISLIVVAFYALVYGLNLLASMNFVLLLMIGIVQIVLSWVFVVMTYRINMALLATSAGADVRSIIQCADYARGQNWRLFFTAMVIGLPLVFFMTLLIFVMDALGGSPAGMLTFLSNPIYSILLLCGTLMLALGLEAGVLASVYKQLVPDFVDGFAVEDAEDETPESVV